jgi:hypothetical protein
MLTTIQRNLFRYINYKFSTSEHGRLTSLYFEDAHGVQGRWRREHRDGPLLVYQGRSARLYISPQEIVNFHPDIALPIYRDLLDRIGNYPNYSVLPVSGRHVIELCPPKFYFRHGSGGTVILNDPSAGSADFASLDNYTGNIVDWTSPEG